MSVSAPPAPGQPNAIKPPPIAQQTKPEGNTPQESDHGPNAAGRFNFRRLWPMVLVAAAIIPTWLHVGEPKPGWSIIGLAAAIIGGWPIYKEAFTNLLHRRMTMELSMTIALVAALAIGQFLTALVILFFVLMAEELERLTVGRGRKAIHKLVEMLPRNAEVRRNGSMVEIAADSLLPGDLVIIRPGGHIAVDGEVVKGNSAVDQAAITGESMPVEKLPGSTVYAGTINQSGTLEIRTTGIGRNTAFGKIIEAVERAEGQRAGVQKTADRLAGYLVYFALACAVVTLLVTKNVDSTISVIIVAGACGVAAGTPLAILGAIGAAAIQGAIIKGGIHLESLWRTDTVVLDKTGTLTTGKPIVISMTPVGPFSEQDLLTAAAIAEIRSEHPLARAIMHRAQEHNIIIPEPDTFEYTPGKGVRCMFNGQEILAGSTRLMNDHQIPLPAAVMQHDGESHTCIARAGGLVGIIQMADPVRPQAAAAIKALHVMGIRTVLLTGDSTAIAHRVGKELGIDEIHAELLPDEKVEHIRLLKQQGRHVAMVGDGVNDAPALVEAQVGVAMGSGTDVARESADVVLLGNDLLQFTQTMQLSRRCRNIIRFNFIGTLGVDSIGMVLAAAGLLNPLLAALIHVSSETGFILNSARLLKRRIPPATGTSPG